MVYVLCWVYNWQSIYYFVNWNKLPDRGETFFCHSPNQVGRDKVEYCTTHPTPFKLKGHFGQCKKLIFIVGPPFEKNKLRSYEVVLQIIISDTIDQQNNERAYKNALKMNTNYQLDSQPQQLHYHNFSEVSTVNIITKQPEFFPNVL